MSNIAPEKDPFPSFHFDGLVNPFLGYGTTRDKVGQGSFFASVPLSFAELHAMYYGGDIPPAIVDTRPEEMFRRGYTLCSAKDEGAAHELQKSLKELHLDRKIREALVAGRLWGGALLVIGAIDGQDDLSQPLALERVREVRYLNVVDRRFASVNKWQTNALLPDYGEPEIYSISGFDSPPATIHASRVIRFVGVEPDQVTRRQFGGWGYSVLQRPYDVIRMFETAFASSGVLLSDASQAVWKIKDLVELVATNRTLLETRMAISDMSRSAGRGIMVDAENEDFTRVATSFAGIDAMLDRFMMRLAAAAKMPVTLMMGRSPAGQNATGDSDFRAFYDSCGKDQAEIAEPALKRVYTIASAGKLDDLDVDFAPLWAPSDAEKATTKKTEAETDKIYVDMGALHPEEVALARFGEGNGEFEIDEEGLQKSLEEERKLALQPKPEPELGPDGQPLPPAPPGAAPTTPPNEVPPKPEEEPKGE